MNYKTQVFSEQHLKDGVKGLEVVTTEPVKKDQRIFDKAWKEIDNGLGQVIIYDPIKGKSKTICEVGEVRQAVNEKGEKLWFCSQCSMISRKDYSRVDDTLHFYCKHSMDKISVTVWKYMYVDDKKQHFKSLGWEPLLFRLEKIDTHEYDTEKSWLKSWKAKK